MLSEEHQGISKDSSIYKLSTFLDVDGIIKMKIRLILIFYLSKLSAQHCCQPCQDWLNRLFFTFIQKIVTKIPRLLRELFATLTGDQGEKETYEVFLQNVRMKNVYP